MQRAAASSQPSPHDASVLVKVQDGSVGLQAEPANPQRKRARAIKEEDAITISDDSDGEEQPPTRKPKGGAVRGKAGGPLCAPPVCHPCSQLASEACHDPNIFQLHDMWADLSIIVHRLSAIAPPNHNHTSGPPPCILASHPGAKGSKGRPTRTRRPSERASAAFGAEEDETDPDDLQADMWVGGGSRVPISHPRPI